MLRLSLFLALLGGVLLAAPASAQLLPAFGEEQAGRSGFQFLKVPIDARAAALGETVVSNAFDASALFWNPALAAQAGDLEVALAHTQYYAETTLNYVAGIYRVGGYSFGLSVQSFDAGEMAVTTEFEPDGTGETFGFNDLAVGATVSQALTDLFSYGVTLKYIRESTAGLVAQTGALDLGVFYRVGETGAQLGVAIRNFGLDGRYDGDLDRVEIGQGVVPVDGYERITPPTTFLLGVSYHLLRASDQHALLVSGQLTNPSDNAERFNFGAEYTWNDLLILRSGYQFGLEENTVPSFGLGVAVPLADLALRADYGFSRLDRLGSVHRVGLNLRF